jgi:DNA-binding CsgD family transcriptional regulator
VTVSGSDASGRARSAATRIEHLADETFDQARFRVECLRRLRALLSVDAAFFASVDPETLLFTSAMAEEPLAQSTPLFLDNEFSLEDVNKFASLAGADDTIGSLDQATHGDRRASARYRDVLAPLGLGDEVRVALVSGGWCWGVLCLHREESSLGFDDDELSSLRRLAPYMAQGLRSSITVFPTSPEPAPTAGPGIIILGADLAVISINPQAEHWLADIDQSDWPERSELPVPVLAAAAQAAGHTHAMVPPTRLRRGQGGWLTVHASRLTGPTTRQIAVILDAAGAPQVSSLILAAHGLTPAQTRVAALVIQGRSTHSMVDELHISSNTLQEHLHAVFDKLGVGSRRELIAALSGRPH